MFEFALQKTAGDSKARLGRITTSHGTIDTPIFMPVGTHATVKAMTPDEVAELGAQIILGNTYHLYLRPGHERIQRLGGLHKFMNWPKPILTDSGGYQIFSLAGEATHHETPIQVKLSEEGVSFQSPVDGGKRHFFTPERVVEIQEALESDIMMVLDECLGYPADETRARESMELSLKWAERALKAKRSANALFAIIQGGMVPELRREYIERLSGEFDGYAIGGLSVGEPNQLMVEIVEVCTERMPAAKPRYLMGVGTPEDLLIGIEKGVDMFDCVMPTRHARNGMLFTSTGDLNMLNAEHADNPAPVDAACACTTCRQYSRAYLRHLMKAGEILGARLCTLHNLHFYLNLVSEARTAIQTDTFTAFKQRVLAARKGDSLC